MSTCWIQNPAIKFSPEYNEVHLDMGNNHLAPYQQQWKYPEAATLAVT